jgi:hypothetical protein
MSDPMYKWVDGAVVELTPEEVAEVKATALRESARAWIAQPEFDMGPSMRNVLTGGTG